MSKGTKLKKKCCEKYLKKGKRCSRCPILSSGYASCESLEKPSKKKDKKKKKKAKKKKK